MGRLSDEYQWSSKLWEVQCVAAGVTELANPRQLVVVVVARVYSP